MIESAPETATEPLLFNWDSPQYQRAAFLAFLAVSLLAHAVCFYVFQVVYPPAITLLPPPARVALITPGSEEGRTLLRWIDAEDPALAFTTHRAPEAGLRALPKVDHVPSYHAMQPTLKGLPPLEVDTHAPDPQPPAALPRIRKKIASPAAPILTSVWFSSELDRLGPATFPELKFVSSNRETPEAIRFRVGVNGSGQIRYCFPINSSGDPSLDEQARLYLTRTRFSQDGRGGTNREAPLIWGIATIEWGTDIARPQAKQQGNATP